MEIPVLIYGHGIGADLRPRRLRSLLPGVGKGVLAAVFAVFVNAHSEEGNHHHGDAQVAAVAVAVLDNIGEAGHGDGHGEDNDEGGDDGAADGGGLDALEDAELFKPGHEAENSGHACGDEAEEQAGRAKLKEMTVEERSTDSDRGIQKIVGNQMLNHAGV